MLAANTFSRCLAVAQGFVQRLLICIHCVVLGFFLTGLLSLNNAFIQELLITQCTMVSPRWSGHAQHLYTYCISLFSLFSSILCSGSASLAVVRAVMLPEAVRLPQCGLFHG